MTPAARCIATVLALASPAVAAADTARLNDVAVSDADNSVRIVMQFNRVPEYAISELDSPPRLVMDFRQTRFVAAGPAITADSILIKRVRHARRGTDGYRLVFDLAAGVGGAYTARRPQGEARELVVTVRHPQGLRRRFAEAERAPAAAPRDAVVVIDPGHGGKDTGAIGARGSYEKNVALAVSRRLRDLISREYGMRALLTRDGDRFVSLRKRVAFAHRHRADLFVSVHADAAPTPRARGASVYRLSHKGASTEAARLLAQRENAADLMGGVALQDKDETLASILIDLSQTAAMERSAKLASALLQGFGEIAKNRRIEAAGFAVLKSPDTPSVLVELGYLTNPKEETRLNDQRYQRRLASKLATGIRRYFAEHATPDLLLARTSVVEYKVRSGDTLSEIALKFKTSVAEIKRFSGIKSDRIRVGQKLRVPVRKAPAGKKPR